MQEEKKEILEANKVVLMNNRQEKRTLFNRILSRLWKQIPADLNHTDFRKPLLPHLEYKESCKWSCNCKLNVTVLIEF